MYPVLKLMHILNFLDTFSVGVTEGDLLSSFLSLIAAEGLNVLMYAIMEARFYTSFVVGVSFIYTSPMRLCW